MTRPFRTTLLLILLMSSVSSPALARMVIGVTPAVMPGAANRATVAALEQELTARTGETVQVRSFDSEALQIDWLIRFRELDAALVSRSQMGDLPAGTMITLADLPPAVAVTHPGMAAGQLDVLRRGFRSLAEDDRGRQLLKHLAGTAKAPVAAKPVPLPPAAPSAPAKPAPVATTAPAKPETITPAVHPPIPPIVAPAPVTSRAAEPLPPTAPAAPPVQPVVAPAAPPPPAKAPIIRTPALKPQPSASPATAAPQTVEPTSPKRTRLLLIAALVILAGIGVKSMLLMRLWQQRRQAQNAPPQPPSAETFDYQGADAQITPPAVAPSLPPAPAPQSAAAELPTKKSPASKRKTVAAKGSDDPLPPANEALVVEQGRLGKTKVPALLKRCADLPQPVILRVRTQGNEICAHFAAGQICHAYSRDWRAAGEDRQWSRLSYLMVRDGLISEAQRDQALELIERQEGLRLPAALQQLGIFDVEALRHILARQAKTTLFALILFSAGEYRIEADSGAIPAEESISLRVEELIREASHHQAEWTAIRKVLPTLDTLLDFAPDGREKLDQVRLSAHQQLLLSQVDGQTTLGTLCNASTMMDYEVSRFLYLMVKAGVLQVVPAS